jgi:hypothetical protein
MMKEEDNELNARSQRPVNAESDVARKPYIRPRLTLYGDVNVITQGADMGNKDGNQTGNSLAGNV